MNTKSKWACIFSIQSLVGSGWAYLWTLTTPDTVDLTELSKRWRKLISNGFTPCVRVFEPHPGGHGFHVHFVTAERIDVDHLRAKAETAGFGRINVRRIPGAKARYVAKYLTKGRSQRGVRLWACIGHEGSRVADIRITDTRRDEISMILRAFPAPAGYNFKIAWELAVERHRKWWFEALANENNPDYKPPFKALHDHWVKSQLCSLRKLPSWKPTRESVGEEMTLNFNGGVES